LTDIIACCAPIGLFFGRIANFINGELYGKISDLPWAVTFPAGGNVPRHPSQIYEALLEGVLLFIIINFFALKKEFILRKSSISILFLISYSALRIVGEFFREPDLQLGYFFNYFSMGILLSIITILSALLLVFFKK
jgi:phosphatidylglycerol:prolipoprotein diacylglycerol transferase